MGVNMRLFMLIVSFTATNVVTGEKTEISSLKKLEKHIQDDQTKTITNQSSQCLDKIVISFEKNGNLHNKNYTLLSDNHNSTCKCLYQKEKDQTRYCIIQRQQTTATNAPNPISSCENRIILNISKSGITSSFIYNLMSTSSSQCNGSCSYQKEGDHENNTFCFTNSSTIATLCQHQIVLKLNKNG